MGILNVVGGVVLCMAQVNISEETKKELEEIRDAEGHKSLDSVIKLLAERADHAETYQKLLNTNDVNMNAETRNEPEENTENSDSNGVVDRAIEYQEGITELKGKYSNIDDTDLKRLFRYACEECNSVSDAMKYVEGYIQGYNMREREEMRNEMDSKNITSIEDGVVFLREETSVDVKPKDENALQKLVNQYNVPIDEAIASMIWNINQEQLPAVTTIESSPTMIQVSHDSEEDPFSETPSYESQTPTKTPVSESVKQDRVTNAETQEKSNDSERPQRLSVDFEDEDENKNE